MFDVRMFVVLALLVLMGPLAAPVLALLAAIWLQPDVSSKPRSQVLILSACVTGGAAVLFLMDALMTRCLPCGAHFPVLNTMSMLRVFQPDLLTSSQGWKIGVAQLLPQQFATIVLLYSFLNAPGYVRLPASPAPALTRGARLAGASLHAPLVLFLLTCYVPAFPLFLGRPFWFPLQFLFLFFLHDMFILSVLGFRALLPPA